MEYSIQTQQDGRAVHVTLNFREPLGASTVEYVAAAPPDYRMSFSGSALPFANADQAFANTPNKGSVTVHSGSNTCTLELMMPNSYMVKLGTIQVPPTVFVSFIKANGQKQVVPVKLSEPVPFRMLTYPSGPFTRPRVDAMFYDNPDVPIGTQEQILRASAYPDVMKMPENFWGQKPPM